MTKLDHKACIFFSDWCRKRSISLEPIPESCEPNVRQPDFKLSINGKPIVVEVKAIEKVKGSDNLVFDVRKNGIPSIRKKIRKADGQLRQYANQGISGIVCIIDYTGEGLLHYPIDVYYAMFGDLKVEASVPRDRSHPPRIKSHKFAGNETLTPEHNKSTSAVLTFYQPSQGCFKATLYHNPFARCPIPEDCASRLADYQYPDNKETRVLGYIT